MEKVNDRKIRPLENAQRLLARATYSIRKIQLRSIVMNWVYVLPISSAADYGFYSTRAFFLAVDHV